MLWVFIEEVRDGLLVTLRKLILCLQSETQVTQQMADSKEEIKECLMTQSMLALNDATFVSASC